MVDQVRIQSRINRGYGKAAKRLGALFAHYRPITPTPVLVNYNMVDQVMLAFDPNPAFTFGKPDGYKESDIYYGLCDLSTVAIGDYFYDFADHTFFCANFEPLKPAMFVRCSRTVNVYRPASDNGYGGSTGPIEILTQWPAGFDLGTKGEANVSRMPESVRAPWAIIHLPYLPGVTIEYGDIIIDDLNRRYVVSENQLAPWPGWHLTVTFESP